MKFKTVLFDFDGTLANTLPLTIYGIQTIFKKYDQQAIDPAGVISMFGPPEDEMIAKNLRHKENVDQACADYYAIYEQDHKKFVQDNPAIRELLRELHHQGIQVGLITGKSRHSFELSEKALGFQQMFGSVITGDDVSEPKPSPEGILKTMNKFHADPETSIYIGDSNSDVQAGKAAGIHTAAVQWLEMSQSSQFPAEPDFLWTSVSQFITLLKEPRDR